MANNNDKKVPTEEEMKRLRKRYKKRMQKADQEDRGLLKMQREATDNVSPDDEATPKLQKCKLMENVSYTFERGLDESPWVYDGPLEDLDEKSDIGE